MKLIIDIPDDYVEEFKMQQKLLGDTLSDVIDSKYSMARYSIANGIPLEDIEKQIAEKSFTGNDGLDYVEMLVVCKTLKGE